MTELKHGARCSCTRCRGFQPGNEIGVQFEPGNELSLKHGAHSDRQIRPLAETHRRRLLRQLGLRLGDLDPVGRAYLDQYVRVCARQDLLDVSFARDPETHASLSVSLSNSAHRLLKSLDRHLQAKRPAKTPLQAYLTNGGDRA